MERVGWDSVGFWQRLSSIPARQVLQTTVGMTLGAFSTSCATVKPWLKAERNIGHVFHVWGSKGVDNFGATWSPQPADLHPKQAFAACPTTQSFCGKSSPRPLSKQNTASLPQQPTHREIGMYIHTCVCMYVCICIYTWTPKVCNIMAF